MPQWNSVGKSLYLFLITCHKMVNLKHSIYLLHPFPKNALLFLFLILFFFILLSKSQYKCLQHLRNLFWTSKAIVTFICVHTVSCLYLTFYFSCHSLSTLLQHYKVLHDRGSICDRDIYICGLDREKFSVYLTSKWNNLYKRYPNWGGIPPNLRDLLCITEMVNLKGNYSLFSKVCIGQGLSYSNHQLWP